LWESSERKKKGQQLLPPARSPHSTVNPELPTTMTVGNVDRPPPGQGSRGASGEAAEERREQVRVVSGEWKRKKNKARFGAVALANGEEK